MKVKLKGNYNEMSNPLHYVLSNRGIKEEDWEKVINPTEELLPDWKLLDNIERGVDLLRLHVEFNEGKIGILTDPDMDGLTSTAVIYKYLIQHLNVNKNRVELIMPKGKAHGINLERVRAKLSKGDLLITPDAASSDFKEHKSLYKSGIATLVIDHHLAPKEDTPACIINNQLSEKFPNKSLTGSAMAYLFCVAYSEINGYKNPPKDLMDLSAMGLVADRAFFPTDLGAYYLMREGLKSKNINSKMLKTTIKKNGNMEENTDLTAKDIGFNVAPMFNSVFRMGTEDELEQVLHGTCEFDYMIHNKRKKMDIPIVEEAYLRAAAVKRRQKKQEDDVIAKITERIKEKGSDNHKVLIVNSSGIIENNGLNGLVAMKLVREYKRPVLMVKLIGNKLKGSARNLNNSPITDLNKLLTSTGKFVCKGHANAFGVEFDVSDAMQVQSVLDEVLQDVDYDDIEHEVDFEWVNRVDTRVIHDLASNNDIWCNGIDEPLIHIKEIYINKKDLNFIGKTGKTLKINIQGVDCVKFNISENDKAALVSGDERFKLSIVGKASLNSFRGMNTPQIMIEDFEIGSVTEETSNEVDLNALPF